MKRALIAALATAALLPAGGCGGTDPSDQSATIGASLVAYPVTVGRLTLPQRPERIVSLTPSATEMLFSIGAGPQVVAVDDQSNYPPTAPMTDLSRFTPSADAIAAEHPDLVVLSDDVDQIGSRLGKLKIPVFLAPAALTMDDTYRQIGQLGVLTGHRGEAEALHQRMTAQINKIVAGVPARRKPLSYYYELDPTLYSVSSKTFIGSIFARFGMTNVADQARTVGGYPRLAPGALVMSNPDMIFLSDSGCCQQSASTVAARTGWKTITAVKFGHIFALDDDIASRWGPRTVDLVQSVADAVATVRG